MADNAAFRAIDVDIRLVVRSLLVCIDVSDGAVIKPKQGHRQCLELGISANVEKRDHLSDLGLDQETQQIVAVDPHVVDAAQAGQLGVSSPTLQSACTRTDLE